MNVKSAAILATGMLAIAGAALVLAGPLSPPAGPVASTYKTLNEIEPRTAINAANTPGDNSALFKITQPGSYYLTGNITGVAGKGGIRVAADNVTIDLCGFTMTGDPQSGHGVTSEFDDRSNLTLRNGTITGWDNGVYADGSDSFGWVVEKLRVVYNRGHGLYLGRHATARECGVRSNAGTGINVIWGGIIDGCDSSYNGQTGIVANYSASVTRCTARSNHAFGIAAGEGTSVTACSADLNTDGGISASGSATIRGCIAVRNMGDGITVTDGCTVLENTCDQNSVGGTGVGIRATGDKNRIEGNQVTTSPTGIAVPLAGNFIARNTARGNTNNFAIGNGNTYGPIISVQGQLSTTNPWANFAN